ncbi:MAG: hypothetical protein QM730_21585 [Anaerolineales bacterium]
MTSLTQKIRRVFIPTLFLTVVAFLFLTVRVASAQDTELVRLLKLSSSGYDRANSIAFSPDGKTLTIGGSAGIYLFDPQSLSSLGYIPTGSWVRSLSFIPNSNILATGLFDHTIKLWDVGTQQGTGSLEGHENWVRNISVSADGSLLASVSDDNTLRLWDVQSQSLLLKISENTDGVRAVAMSPDGSLVAAATRDNAIRIWNVADGSLLFTLEGHTDWTRCLEFSPDGKILASGSFDKTVRLWDVETGTLLHTMEGHTSSVLDLAFSPDGKLLASASVDKSVRLWGVPDGERLQVMRGHSNFVYAVAFSPDGKTLASGGEDNSVYLWNVDKVSALGSASISGTGSVTKNDPGHQQSGADCAMCHQNSGSDCRTCHHPKGISAPPAVVEVRCEVCHANGVSLNWCPVFPRSDEATTTLLSYLGIALPSGVPVSGDGIAVKLTSPANGETLYSKHANVAPVTVTGKVFSSEGSVKGVSVQLDVYAGDELVNTLTTPASSDGSFKFSLALNPTGGLPVSTRPSALDCTNCHDDFHSQGELPQGETRLMVTATESDGKLATDQRWVNVDVSNDVSVPVKVIDSATGSPVANVPIKAMTILYEWKTQYTQELTDKNGDARFNIERLSQAPTMYTFNVEPVEVDGIRYAADAPAQVTLEPDKDTYPLVQLNVHAEDGSLTGKIAGANNNGMEIWALHLPFGPMYQTHVDASGYFKFDTLPVSKYLIQPDTVTLAAQANSVPSQTIDLLEAPSAQLSMNAEESSQLIGSVTGSGDMSLPFAWITVGEKEAAKQISPLSGSFLLDPASSDSFVVTASAPGFYSRSFIVDSNDAPAKVELKLRKDTLLIPWGSGQIILPSDSKAQVEGSHVSLEQGWVWGQGESTTVVELPEGEVQMREGKFAIEHPSIGTAWLYMYDGRATVTMEDGSEIKVQSGEMLAFAKDAHPIAMQDAVIFALHPMLEKSPVPELIEPSINARFENWLTKAGIKSVQIITFVTYIIVLVALLTLPAMMIFSKFRRKEKVSSAQEPR